MRILRTVALAAGLGLVAVLGTAATPPASAGRAPAHTWIQKVAGTGGTDTSLSPVVHYAWLAFTTEQVRGTQAPEALPYAAVAKIVTVATWENALGQPVATCSRTVWVAPRQSVSYSNPGCEVPGKVTKVRVSAVMSTWTGRAWLEVDRVNTPELTVPASDTWFAYPGCTDQPVTSLFTYNDTDP
jgi:hypothetical protein